MSLFSPRFVFAIVLLAMPVSASAQLVFADINADTAVNSVDVQLVINSVLGFDIGEAQPDINRDESTNAIDVQLIINGVLGILTNNNVPIKVDEEGLSYTVTTSNGGEMSITYPPGALPENAEIILSPSANKQDDWLNIQLNPPGLEFSLPVTIVVTAPDDVTLDSNTTLYFGSPSAPYPIPTIVDTNARTLTAEIFTLGYDFEPTSKGNVPPANNIGAGSLACQLRIDGARALLAQMESTTSYQVAQALYDAQQQLSTDSSCNNLLDYDNWVEFLGTTACAQYEAAKAEAAMNDITATGEWARILRFLYAWASEPIALAQTCADDFSSVAEAETEEFLAHYRTLFANPTFDDYTDLRRAGRDFIRIYEELLTLGMLDEAQTFKDEDFASLANALRELSYKLSQDRGTVHYLTQVTRSGIVLPRTPFGERPPAPANPDVLVIPLPYNNEDVFADINLCLTDVTVTSKDASDATLGTITLGGRAPNLGTKGNATHETTGSIEIKEGGKIEISGQIPGLDCYGYDAFSGMGDFVDAEDKLVIYLVSDSGQYEVTEITNTSPRGNFLLGGETLNVSTLFAGSISFEAGETYHLEIWRERPSDSPCHPYLLGPREYKLFDITLTTQEEIQSRLFETSGVIRSQSIVRDKINQETEEIDQQSILLPVSDVVMDASDFPTTFQTISTTATIPGASAANSSVENFVVELNEGSTITGRVKGTLKADTQNLRGFDLHIMRNFVLTSAGFNYHFSAGSGGIAKNRLKTITVTGSVEVTADALVGGMVAYVGFQDDLSQPIVMETLDILELFSFGPVNQTIPINTQRTIPDDEVAFTISPNFEILAERGTGTEKNNYSMTFDIQFTISP